MSSLYNNQQNYSIKLLNILFIFNLNKHIFAVKINNRHEVYILHNAVRPL